jgi:RNase P/RNase MRP subunit p30
MSDEKEEDEIRIPADGKEVIDMAGAETDEKKKRISRLHRLV